MVKIIENYTLHEQIGQGEYGKVYRGIDSRTKKQVAVKVINVKKFKQYPKLEQCTLNQIEILSKISSPHIIKFLEILKTTNNFYFFYEYCNQGTLEALIRSNSGLPQSQALSILSQILEAFKVLSSRNIMHRDLKPSNILLHDGVIKIGDFGFCKGLESGRDLAQTMLGSPIYMAPQVLKGQIYTIKADIWSLGVVCYEMVYGYCPFEERSIARLINLVEKQEVAFGDGKGERKISAGFEELMRRMLVKDHFKRIGWKEIFEYKINGVPILRSSGLEEKEKQKEKEKILSTAQTQPAEQLKQLKNFQNINMVSQRPVSRTSFDFNYQDYSGSKPQTTQPTTMFKKQSQNTSKPSTSPNTHLQSTSNSNPPSASTTISNPSSNKQNQILLTEPVSAGIRSKIFKSKIKNFLKLASDVLEYNYCPQITIQLCLKIYQILHKQILKLDDHSISLSQKLALSDTIRLFQQQSTKIQKSTETASSCNPTSASISGPLLNYYIKNLQINQKQSFQSTNQNKEIIVHCINLLELNQLVGRDARETGSGREPRENRENREGKDYLGLGKEKLISELYQKIIRNVI